MSNVSKTAADIGLISAAGIAKLFNVDRGFAYMRQRKDLSFPRQIKGAEGMGRAMWSVQEINGWRSRYAPNMRIDNTPELDVQMAQAFIRTLTPRKSAVR
jgi:hypothetical protein